MTDTAPGPGGTHTDDSIDALFASGAPVDVKKKRGPRESTLQAQIVKYINSVPGCFAMSYGSVKFRASYRERGSGVLRDRFVNIGHPGVSDVIGWRSVRPGVRMLGAAVPLDGIPIAQFIAIEVKRPGEKPKPHQQRFLDRVQAAGGIAMVARSVEDVRAVIR